MPSGPARLNGSARPTADTRATVRTASASASATSTCGTPSCIAQRNASIAPARSPVTAFSATANPVDRKSTRLNSSHSQISYAVFCLKKKKKKKKEKKNKKKDKNRKKKHNS